MSSKDREIYYRILGWCYKGMEGLKLYAISQNQQSSNKTIVLSKTNGKEHCKIMADSQQFSIECRKSDPREFQYASLPQLAV